LRTDDVGIDQRAKSELVPIGVFKYLYRYHWNHESLEVPAG